MVNLDQKGDTDLERWRALREQDNVRRLVSRTPDLLKGATIDIANVFSQVHELHPERFAFLSKHFSALTISDETVDTVQAAASSISLSFTELPSHFRASLRASQHERLFLLEPYVHTGLAQHMANSIILRIDALAVEKRMLLQTEDTGLQRFALFYLTNGAFHDLPYSPDVHVSPVPPEATNFSLQRLLDASEKLLEAQSVIPAFAKVENYL